MLFTHRVRPEWRKRIPAAVHVDGSARVQTVDRREEPLVARLLDAYERRTRLPILVNTSLNTAGRPMVDTPRDVHPTADWGQRLVEDLAALDDGVAASQGRVVVPLPGGRLPTDWERNVKALETASWITADIAYRRRVLAQLGGFDEGFRHAYREDADLALRAMEAGYTIARGRRRGSTRGGGA